nr:MAG TPA: hypothetical protein [Caudoviricetes sp.]
MLKCRIILYHISAKLRSHPIRWLFCLWLGFLI